MKLTELFWGVIPVLRSVGVEVTHPCTWCQYFRGQARCKAFPKGIPVSVWLGVRPHDKVLPDQEGDFVFTLRKQR